MATKKPAVKTATPAKKAAAAAPAPAPRPLPRVVASSVRALATGSMAVSRYRASVIEGSLVPHVRAISLFGSASHHPSRVDLLFFTREQRAGVLANTADTISFSLSLRLFADMLATLQAGGGKQRIDYSVDANNSSVVQITLASGE